MGRLDGQVVWITGSARRVGRIMALECAREGADVVVHCHRSRQEALSVVAEIQAMGRQALLVEGDQGEPTAVTRMVEEIHTRLGRLTALINNAASFPKAPFEEITGEEFHAVIRTNLFGPFLCSQKALPLLRQASPGRIVNITDWSVERPYRDHAHYMAAKGGLATLTKALARELAPAVLVNAIAPGPVLEPEDLDDATRQKILQRIPVGRWGTPDSVAKALLFLLESDNLCGETITVDGGRAVG
jgi:pteridine reductase